MSSKTLIVAASIIAVFFIFNTTYAHPGNTAADGCHYCRTNCDSWGVPWNTRHCHGGTTPPPPVIEPVITTKTETTTEFIPFETVYKNDVNLEEGKEIVIQEGAAGIRTITFKVTLTDGKETARTKTSEVVTIEPTTKIVSKGTKKKEVVPTNNEPEVNQNIEVAGASIDNTFGGFLVLVLIGGGYYFYKKMRNKLDEKQ